MDRRLVTDDLWAIIKPLLPPALPRRRDKHHRGGRPAVDDRQVLTGIVFVLKTGVPWVRGKRGRPRRRFERSQGDRAYDSEPHRRALRRRRIEPLLARRRAAHGSGLGVYRWVVERAESWLHQNRHLKIRYDHRDDIHEAFLALACALICLNCLADPAC